MISKNAIRKILRTRRQSLSNEEKHSSSQKICHQLMALPAYQNATHVACYLATLHEVDLELLMKHAWQQNKKIYLPVITNSSARTMDFYPYTQNTALALGKHNIKEPDILNCAPINPLQLELIITPLLGFDEQRNRLGQGAGFYDRYFKQYPQQKTTPFIGVAFEIQKTEHLLPVDDWDITLDRVVTERCIY